MSAIAIPRVVEAICAQQATLNTHTRYLHRGILDYVERLTATFDHDLGQAILTCTGSEANDVALRMAQAATGQTGIIATDNTYHGNTAAVSQLNTRRPPIGGYPGHVRLIPAPDSVDPVGGSRDGQPQAFARNLHRAVVELEEAGFGLAALILAPVFANEGLPDVEPGFLDPAIGRAAPRPRAGHRRRGAAGLRPHGQPFLGPSGAGLRPRHRHHGQADGQRLSGRRRGHRGPR